MSEITIQEAFGKAIAAHRENRFQEAEQLYKAILQVQPNHMDANHNLGILAIALGQFQAALPFLQVAVEADPEYSLYWISYITALIRSQRLEAARQALSQADAAGMEKAEHQRLAQLLDAAARDLEESAPARRETFTEQRKRSKGKSSQKPAPGIQTPSEADVAPMVKAFQAGMFQDAENRAREFLSIFPKHFIGWKMVGAILQQTNYLADAAYAMQRAAELNPADWEVHFNLGIQLTALGRLEQAEAAYRKAARLHPGLADIHGNLGVVLNRLGRDADAVQSYQAALSRRPNDVQTLINLSLALNALQRYAEAETSCRQAIQLHPTAAEPHALLSTILSHLGRLEEAEACCKEAVSLRPDYVEAYNALGLTLRGLGRFEEATAAFKQALALHPQFADAHGNLGSVLTDLDLFAEAEFHCQECARLAPDCAEAHANLALVHYELGRFEASQASYERAVQLKPRESKWHFSSQLMLPKILSTAGSIESWRTRYATGISRLEALGGNFSTPEAGLSNSTFNLAYHGRNNKPILEAVSCLCRHRYPALNFTAPHVLNWTAPADRKIRLGICSEFLAAHTIGRLYRGLLAGLRRDRFEVVLIHGSQTKRDSYSGTLDALADEVLQLPANLQAQQGMVSASKLDLVFYPDIGMGAETYFLAHSRLAPVQAVSWGHPDTTGIDTLDYFVSSAWIEPTEADQHYSERLVRMNRLPCRYEPLELSAESFSKAELGLPSTGRLYGCPQSLFKLHPEFDAVLDKILELDGSGHIILLEGQHKSWRKLLLQRWSQEFPRLCERVIFLPRMPHGKFMALMAHFDLLLDPIHFGSGNTMYESLAHGTPIMTWPGEFMRGRIVAGAYSQMGLADAPVVTRLEDYARTAVAWAGNADRLSRFRSESRAAAVRHLFTDAQAVREFEAFAEAALQAAARGEKLEPGWSPRA